MKDVFISGRDDLFTVIKRITTVRNYVARKQIYVWISHDFSYASHRQESER